MHKRGGHFICFTHTTDTNLLKYLHICIPTCWHMRYLHTKQLHTNTHANACVFLFLYNIVPNLSMPTYIPSNQHSCISTFIYICISTNISSHPYTRTNILPALMNSCIPAYIPACLHNQLISLHICTPSYLPAYLHTSFYSFISAYQLLFLHICIPAYIPAYLHACLYLHTSL